MFHYAVYLILILHRNESRTPKATKMEIFCVNN